MDTHLSSGEMLSCCEFTLCMVLIGKWGCILCFTVALFIHLPHLLIVILHQIEIKELDDIAQAAFHGYKSLNRIQSRIFHTVYNTNENILVRILF